MILLRCAVGLCKWSMTDTDAEGAITLGQAHARGMHNGNFCAVLSNEGPVVL